MSDRSGDPLRVAAALLLLAAAHASAGAEIPRNKKVIDIDVIPGKLGPVHFLHAAHASVGWKADRSPVTCKDCHHVFGAGDVPGMPQEMRCGACHPGIGEPDRIVDGRRARPMARLKPDGAVDYRTILFHDYCRDCHKKVEDGELRLQHCRVCHPRGIGTDAAHGRYDAVRLPDAELGWLRCPAGQRWSGKRCEGEAARTSLAEAPRACPEGCRLPSRRELVGVLAGCAPAVTEGQAGSCRPCRDSPTCAALIGEDGGTYWVAPGASGAGAEEGWIFRPSEGSFQAAPAGATAGVRCVQPAP